LIIPLEDEEKYINTLMAKKIGTWGLDERQKEKVKIRLFLQGYSSDRQKAALFIQDFLIQHHFPDSINLDLNKLKISNDLTRTEIALEVQRKINELELIESPDEPGVDDYILAAMNQIYKG
jgi:hypothetical protein